MVIILFAVAVGYIYISVRSNHLQHDQNKSFQIYASLKLVFWVFHLIIIFFGFCLTYQFNQKQKSFTGFQMSMLFSVMGYVISFIFSVTALAKFHQYLFILEKTCNLLEVVFQALFLFRVTSLDFKKSKNLYPTKFRISLWIVLFIGFSNMIIWGVDSFYEVDHFSVITPFETKFYTKEVWDKFVHAIYPVILFFRFNSGSSLFCIF